MSAVYGVLAWLTPWHVVVGPFTRLEEDTLSWYYFAPSRVNALLSSTP